MILTSEYASGGLDALKNFRMELLERREEIELDPESPFDAVLALLDRIISALEGFK